MEQRYLVDTNATIDYLDNKLPDNGASLIDSIVVQISVITRMAFRLDKCHYSTIRNFIAVCKRFYGV